ncbi:hypothetical protein E2C01_049775 [Portunus trituberculatus]|uniref:Uncharacterized protein n=1 Tax=Portunus trituberculatus TaxID=210409 RepID=A0A5B7G6H4_PORTR|nr:hypothetical protein [Portunus trituberculatus]
MYGDSRPTREAEGRKGASGYGLRIINSGYVKLGSASFTLKGGATSPTYLSAAAACHRSGPSSLHQSLLFVDIFVTSLPRQGVNELVSTQHDTEHEREH